MKHEPNFALEIVDDGLGLLAMRTRVFGGVEKVWALGANGVVRGSTIGVIWLKVGGGMVSAKVVSMVVLGLSCECLGEVSLEDRDSPLHGRSGGESDEAEVKGVRVGRRGLLPLDLNRKTLLLERGIMTWSTSWKSLDKRIYEHYERDDNGDQDGAWDFPDCFHEVTGDSLREENEKRLWRGVKGVLNFEWILPPEILRQDIIS
ncbi:hypothetical protein Tco_0474969 [Tanacetum coccineum]